MRRKPIGFDQRLQHSIELLQKAEKLALRYDGADGFFLAFSGGKDSQALYHVAQMGGVKFRAHMNFTSVDPPQVIRFVRKHYPDVVTHAPQWSIFTRAVERGILPSMRVRWCCADFKEQAGAGKVTLIGIRKQESTRRARRHEVEVPNRKFSGNLEEFGQWQEQEIRRKEEKLMRKMKREGKKVNEDFFTANKENEVRCIGGKDSILISPIFEWSEQDVWYFLDEVVRVPHCELYDQGWHRIGCINCPMASAKQKVRENERWPHVKRNWVKAIMRIRGGATPIRRTSGEPTAQQRQCSGGQKREYPPVRLDGGGRIRGTARPDFRIPRQWMQEERNWQCSTTAYRRDGNYAEQQLYPPADEHRTVGGFSGDSSSVGLTEEQEYEIAENIYDWWISGKGYKQWYADKYLQTKIDFKDD